jgi:hypothetical protein
MILLRHLSRAAAAQNALLYTRFAVQKPTQIV